jgi:putative pyruvate formate lyase activating enzyme
LANILLQRPETLNFGAMKELDHCMICPRFCGVNRNMGKTGYCKAGAGYHISSICIHRGEEPVISGANGICNIFFSHCNLQCIFCQNFQISRNKGLVEERIMVLDEVVESVITCLNQGAEAVGFVTPSHFVPHVKDIISALHTRGFYPVTVYNSNGYDTVDSLRSLEGLVDVYLPDLKYASPFLSKSFSDASDYPEVAKKAIAEMYRQKGSSLVVSDTGQAANGLIIRHLVLPGQTEDSLAVLKWISEELSPSLHISLMSQYYPTSCMVTHSPLNRKITEEEYAVVEKAMEDFGFYNGWIQEMSSAHNYKPDFLKADPFLPTDNP